MDEKIYLHGIYAQTDTYNSKETLKILKQILKSNALLSINKQNKKGVNCLFNGYDYISLCDYEKKDIKLPNKYNSYEGYIRYSLSIIFPKNKLQVITPEIIDIQYDRDYYRKMEYYGMSSEKRYTDMPDEVQVKDIISLDLMSGVTIPISKIHKPFTSKSKNIDIAIKEIEAIKKLLATYNYNVPIYDIDTFEAIENEEDIKRLIKKYRG